MKRIALTSTLSFIIGLTFLAGSVKAQEGNRPARAQKPEVEVYYFHMTQRCMTCKTVEKVAEQSVNELYPAEVKAGKVTFSSVNAEEKANKDLIKKLKVDGQSLLIIHGSDRYDITDKGFLYAVNEPEKLKAEMKTILDKLVK